MHDDSNTESIDIKLVNGLLLVIGNDLWSNEARSTTFSEDDVFLIMEGSKAIVYYFKTLTSSIFIQWILLFEEDILWFYVTMHDVFFLQVLDAFEKLLYYCPHLVWF